jgi:hypothetical protein
MTDLGHNVTPLELDDLQGIPLTGRPARRFVLQLFEQQAQWDRRQLAAEVERMHRQRGGIAGTQPPVTVVKKVLSELKEEGAVRNVGMGIWRKAGPGAGPDVVVQDEPAHLGELADDSSGQLDEEDEEDVTVIEYIGTGAESVYVYYNPNDRELARLKGLDCWECKIGRTLGEVASRVIRQGAKTALSHPPIIGLVIRTDNAALLESALHASLRLSDRQVLDSPGAEWYFTSPGKVKEWYQAFGQGLALLARPEGGSA